MVVWMLAVAATGSGRSPIIIILTYIVGLAGLTHIVAGSVEVLFLVMTGAESRFSFLGGYMVPTLIGNIVGGVSLVSALKPWTSGFTPRVKRHPLPVTLPLERADQ